MLAFQRGSGVHPRGSLSVRVSLLEPARLAPAPGVVTLEVVIGMVMRAFCYMVWFVILGRGFVRMQSLYINILSTSARNS